MNVAVVGSRTFSDYELVKDELRWLSPEDTIISGGAQGADLLGAKYAREIGCELIEHLPDWDKYGKKAGFLRNIDIIKDSDMVYAFWDGVSKGTKHSIDLAEKHDKPCIVVERV